MLVHMDFAGFSPTPMGAFTRSARSYGLYVDVENQVSDQFLLGGSFRYEDYTSFGDTKTTSEIKC